MAVELSWGRHTKGTLERGGKSARPEPTTAKTYLFSSHWMAPNIAEQTKPTRSASIRNFRFFLVTFGSGSEGLGLAGIMTGNGDAAVWRDGRRQGLCFE